MEALESDSPSRHQGYPAAASPAQETEAGTGKGGPQGTSLDQEAETLRFSGQRESPSGDRLNKEKEGPDHPPRNDRFIDSPETISSAQGEKDPDQSS